MKGWESVDAEMTNSLTCQLADNLGIDSSMVMPFVDFTDLLRDLLNHLPNQSNRLLVGGLATPDVAIAADRAGWEITEILGSSPFTGDLEVLIKALTGTQDVVYLASPNRVTGTNFSSSDIDRIAGATREGTLILDEKLFDFNGISGLSLLEKYAHVVLTRSLTASFGIGSDDSGYLAGPASLIAGLRQTAMAEMTATRHRILFTTLASEDARSKWCEMLQGEAFRIATDLIEIGVQNKLMATDFLLLRVTDPKRVGNFLAGYGVPVENLDGYPQLKNYIRYRIQSQLSNDDLLTAFKRMPPEYYQMPDIDKRPMTIHRAESQLETQGEVDSNQVWQSVSDRHSSHKALSEVGK